MGRTRAHRVKGRSARGVRGGYSISGGAVRLGASERVSRRVTRVGIMTVEHECRLFMKVE